MIENMERGARNIGVEELRAQVDKASFATIDALKSPLGADKRSFYEGLLENLNGARAWMSYNKLRYTSAVVLGITFLTSCAPAIVVVPIPDGEPNRPTITQAAPIPTETATKTATATETPSPESQLPPEMTEKYLSQFEKTEEGTRQINGMDTNIIYGVKADGTKQVIAMNIEIDGNMRMTRVGEYTDEAGFSYYTVMGNVGEIDGSMGGRFNVTDDTTKKLFTIDENKNIVNIWNSLASQWGLTPEQARDRVMIDNKGLAKFNVAVGIPTSNASFPSKSYGLPNEVNFNLPVEIVTIATHEAFDALPEDLKTNLVYDHEIRRISQDGDGDPINGGLVWVKKNGQLQIISVGTPVGHWGYLSPESLREDVRPGTNKYLKEHIVPQVLLIVDLISNPNAPVPSNGVNAYFSQMNNVFEIDGFVNSSSH